MAATLKLSTLAKICPNQVLRASVCRYTDQAGAKSPSSTTEKPVSTTSSTSDATTTQQQQVADDNKSYLTQEYYQYNEYSFYDIESDMSPHRLPQVSSKQL